MSGQTENRTISILINDKQLDEVLTRQKANYAKLEQQIKKLEPGTDAYIKKAAEMEKVNAKINQTEGILSGKLSPTLSMLQKQQRDLNNVLSHMPIELAKTSREAQQLEAVKAKISQIKQEALGAGVAVKQLGNEQTSFAQKAKNGLSGLADGFNKYFGVVTAGLAALTGIVFSFKKAVDAANQFEDSVANLSSLTGLTGNNLKYLEQQAKEMSTSMVEGSVKITKSSKDIIDAYTVVGSQRPELLKNKEALNEVTKQSLILAEASKIDLVDATKAVTTTLNQFNEKGEESKRIINVLAAGSKEGAGDVAYLNEAMEKSGTVANMANLSIEQTVGLIETLAPRFSKAETAGTNLKNILLKLESGSNDTKPSVVGLNTALENLANKNLSTAELTKRFGQENINAAAILIKYRQEVDQYTKAVSGSNVAIEQATVNTGTRAATAAQNMNRIQNNLIAIGEKLAPVMNSGLGLVNKFTSALADMVKVPVSESMEKDRIELLKLESQVLSANVSQGERVKLIKEMQQRYPEYLTNINAETISNEELRTAIRNTNDSLVDKILLQKEDEKIQKQAEDTAERKRKLYDEENNLREAMVKTADRYNIKIKEGLPIYEQANDVLEKWRAAGHRRTTSQMLFGVDDPVGDLGKSIRGFQNWERRVTEATDKANQLANAREKLKNDLGIKDTIVDDTTGTPPPPKPPAGDDLTDEQLAAANKNVQDYLKSIEGAHEQIRAIRQKAIQDDFKVQDETAKENMLNLQDQLNHKEISEQEFALRSKQIQVATSQAKLEVLQRYGEDEYAMLVELDGKKLEFDQLTFEQKLEQLKINNKILSDSTVISYNQAYVAIKENANLTEEEKMQELLALNEQFKNSKTEQEIAFIEGELKLREDANNLTLELETALREKISTIRKNATDKDNNVEIAAIKSKLSQTQQFFSLSQGLVSSFRAYKVAQDNVETANYNKLLANKKAALKDQLESGVITQEQYNAAIAKLDEEAFQRERIKRKDQAEADKRWAVFETGLKAAVAIFEAILEPTKWPQAIAAGAQALIVAATPIPEFYDGGFTPIGSDYTPYAANLHGNEYVIPANMLRDPQVFNVANALESMRTGRTSSMNESTAPVIMQQSTKQVETPTQVSVQMPDELSGKLDRLVNLLESGIRQKLSMDDEFKFKLLRELKEQEIKDSKDLL